MRSLLIAALDRADSGRITFADGEGDHAAGAPRDLDVRVVVHNPRAYRALLHGGRGLGSSYADGWWDCDDLVSLIRIAARAFGRIDPLRARIATVINPVHRAGAALRLNNRSRSRENVRRHYDLGNDFFSLVLDETMGYSCAFYERPDQDPVAASKANLERVCRLLDLKPGERLLELGSGWGGLAVYAARNFGCSVSTVTLSEQQREYIDRIANAQGVGDRVEVLVRDYRDLRGRWDKVVSLEMIESIGPQFLPVYAERVGKLLRPEGLALIQAITTSDLLFRLERYHRTFLNQYIFPGGYVPSLEGILNAFARRSPLRAVAVYDLTPHYPPTLKAWRERLQENWPKIEQLGRFDDAFRRLWTLYFSWTAAGFIERRVFDRQIVMAGPMWRDEDRLVGTA